MLAFKMLPGAFLIACLVVVVLVLREVAPQHALAGTFLLAWNPFVLSETWGNEHNDIAMVFLMLAAALALFKRRYTLAILALVTGALIQLLLAWKNHYRGIAVRAYYTPVKVAAVAFVWFLNH